MGTSLYNVIVYLLKKNSCDTAQKENCAALYTKVRHD